MLGGRGGQYKGNQKFELWTISSDELLFGYNYCCKDVEIESRYSEVGTLKEYQDEFRFVCIYCP